MLRHQALGVLPEFVFSEPPSDEQIKAAADYYAAQTPQACHPKTNEPYWIRAFEVGVLEGDERPMRVLAPSPAQMRIMASGSGTVT